VVFVRKRTFVFFALIVLTAAANAQSTPPASSEARFVSINDNALLSSRLIGLDVRNAGLELIGRIEDVAFEGGQLTGIVLEVGRPSEGATRYVAIDPSSISLNYVEADGRWRATVNADQAHVKAAPEFHYRGKWKR
jgi:hypothetical protein